MVSFVVLLSLQICLASASSLWAGVDGGFMKIVGSSIIPSSPSFQFESCAATGVACANSTFCLVVSSSNGVSCAGETVLVAGYNPQNNIVTMQPFLPRLSPCVDEYGTLSAPIFHNGEFFMIGSGQNSTSGCVFAFNADTTALRYVSHLQPRAGVLTMIYNPLVFVHAQLGAVGCTENSFIDGNQYIECFAFDSGKSVFRTPLTAVGGGTMSIVYCAFSDSLQRLMCVVPGQGSAPGRCIRQTGSTAQLRVMDIATGASRAVLLTTTSAVPLCPFQSGTLIGNQFSVILLESRNTYSIAKFDASAALTANQINVQKSFQIPSQISVNDLLPSPF